MNQMHATDRGNRQTPRVGTPSVENRYKVPMIGGCVKNRETKTRSWFTFDTLGELSCCQGGKPATRLPKRLARPMSATTDIGALDSSE
jgi:hypothetical protein